MALTHDQQNDVRTLYGRGMKASAIGAAYGVTARRVYQIVQEEPATDEEVAEAREAVKAGETQEACAERFGVSQSYVSKLTRRMHEVFDLMDRLHACGADLEETDWELFSRLMTLVEVERRLRESGAHLEDN